MIKTIEEKIEKTIEKIGKIKHLISATASYHGDLIAGDYQFTWGGQSMASYKKHDMFNGFLIPSDGYIKKFVLHSTGIKLNSAKEKNIARFIYYEIGYNNHIPLFTLVLIKHFQESIDIGTLYFYFLDPNTNPDIGDSEIRYAFNFNPKFEKETLRTVKKRDIINIRSEFDSIDITGYRIMLTTPNYDFVLSDFFMYLVTILIELDPL